MLLLSLAQLSTFSDFHQQQDEICMLAGSFQAELLIVKREENRLAETKGIFSDVGWIRLWVVTAAGECAGTQNNPQCVPQ